jgi:pimeloyl-ACP methyl ester carboxylesterase
MYAPAPPAQESHGSWHYVAVPKGTHTRVPVETQPRVRRGYFECRYGQLHVHNAMPPGGGFEEGTPLVCVHDFSGSGRMFTRFLSHAGQDRSVYAPDLPGFGESDAPSARPAIADYALALGDFFDSMRLRHVALFGLRTGALVATELALTRPAQVSRVIMMSVPLLTEAERQAARSAAAPPPPLDSAFRPPEWQRWGLDAAAQYPLRERLARLSQRLLVLRPRDDLWEPTARVRDALPAARLMELEPPTSELLASGPQRLAEAVREFLRAPA